MLRLLVVDDEPEVLDYLYSILIEAERVDLDILKAYSGKEAVQMIRTTKMDLLLCDIRMPGIDGFQLAEIAAGCWPKCRNIFLTGYDNFNYAYSAIKLSCEDYLLKTATKEMILQSIDKAIEKIKTDLQTEELLVRAQRQRKRMLPLIQRDIILKIVENSVVQADFDQSQLDELEIPLDFNCEVFVFWGSTDSNQSVTANNQSLSDVTSAMAEISEDVLNRYGRKVVLECENRSIIGLLQQDGMKSKAATEPDIRVVLGGLLENIQDIVRETLGITISFAYCNQPVKWAEISKKRKELKKILDFSWGFREEALFTDITHLDKVIENAIEYGDELKGTKVISEREGSFIRDYLERGMRNEYYELLKKMTDALLEVRSMHSLLAQEIYFTIAYHLLSYINYWNVTCQLSLRVALYKLTNIDSHVSWKEAVGYLFDLSNAIFDLRESNQVNMKMTLVTFVKQYIRNHLADDLSLSTLASVVYHNPSYLSRLFKNATGINLSSFIIDERIQASIPLLQDADAKVQEIAHRVGFESPTYFIRTFRRKMNMTPQEYRDTIMQQTE